MTKLAPQLPLQISEIDGAYKLIDNYTDLTKQNFKMLLYTMPGERIMNPDYGVGLKRYLFENNITQEIVQSQVKARILSQVEKYMSYIDITALNFTSFEDGNGLHIYVEYYITPLGSYETLTITENIDSLF